MKKIGILFSLLAAVCLGTVVPGRAALFDTAGESTLQLQGGVDYAKASGAPRLTDIAYFDIYATLTQQLSPSLSMSVGQFGKHYTFPTQGRLYQNNTGISMEYFPLSTLGLGGRYVYKTFENMLPTRDAYDVYLWYRAFSFLDLRAGLGKGNLANNFGVIKNDVNEKYFTSSATYRITHQASVSVDFKKGDVTDGNKYHTEGIEGKVILLERPAQVYALARLDRTMYDKESQSYYAPADYATLSAKVGYKRGIAIPGVKNAHLDAALTATDDSNSQIALKPDVSVSADLSKTVNASLRYTQTFAPYINDASYAFSITWKP